MKNKKYTILIFAFILLSSYALVKPAAPQTGEANIEALFSPEDDCAKRIISEVGKAKSTIVVAMYYFTSRPMAQALINASLRGVDVRVCLDGSKPSYEYSKAVYLENKNIPMKVITGKGIMHNKYCVIDDKVIITGSYNWTTRADLENDENLLIIRSQDIAKKYKEEFEKLWDGRKIDACQYIDEARAEKAPIEGYIAATALLKTQQNIYICHKGTKKLHLPGCKWAGKIKPENKIEFSTRQEAVDKGYIPCKVCKP